MTIKPDWNVWNELTWGLHQIGTDAQVCGKESWNLLIRGGSAIRSGEGAGPIYKASLRSDPVLYSSFEMLEVNAGGNYHWLSTPPYNDYSDAWNSSCLCHLIEYTSSLSLSHTHSLSLSHTHTLFLSLYLLPSFTFTHSLSCSPSLPITYTHTHYFSIFPSYTLTYIHSFSYLLLTFLSYANYPCPLNTSSLKLTHTLSLSLTLFLSLSLSIKECGVW